MAANCESGSSKLLSPVKKHSRGKGFDSGEKCWIIDVYKSLMNDNPEIRISDIVDMVAKSVGVSASSVYKIVKEYKTTGVLKSAMKTRPRSKTIIKDTNEVVKNAIRRKVHSFSLTEETPTLDKILASINEDPDLPNFKRSSLYRLLRHLGFEFKNKNISGGLQDEESQQGDDGKHCAEFKMSSIKEEITSETCDEDKSVVSADVWAIKKEQNSEDAIKIESYDVRENEDVDKCDEMPSEFISCAPEDETEISVDADCVTGFTCQDPLSTNFDGIIETEEQNQNPQLYLKSEYSGKKHVMSCLDTELNIKSENFDSETTLCNISINDDGGSNEYKHEDTGSFSCDTCNKSLSTARRLEYHKRVHNDKDLLSCSVCKKTFASAYSCKRHERLHTGVRPFSCDICSQSFSDKGNMMAHRQLHLREQLLSCDVCNREYSNIRCFKKHVRSHSGEQSSSCDSCYTTVRDGKIRRKYHSGKHRYPCDVCDSSYVHLGDLKMHVLTHTGEPAS